MRDDGAEGSREPDVTIELNRIVAQAIPDALIATDSEDRVIHWNEGATKVFGYEAAEVMGRPLIGLTVPHERAEEHLRIAEMTHRQGSAGYETLRRRKDGSLIHIDVSSRTLYEAGPRCLLWSKRDITQVKVRRTSGVLLERYGDVLESTPDGVLMVDETGHILLSNARADEMFGYPGNELIGQAVEVLLPPRHVSGHVAHRSGYFHRPRVRAMGAGLDLSGRRKDGTEFPLEISLSPIVSPEGKVVMSAIRDVSDRKATERTLYEKNFELMQASQAKTHFLASMSHELRTPLNAILGFAGTLLMKLPGPLTPEQEKQLRTIQAAGNHLLALINDLLDLTRIESGKTRVQNQHALCSEVARAALSEVQPQADAKRLALDLHVPEQDIAIVTDRRVLHQILLNLLSNAVKYTQRGSVKLVVTEVRDGDAGKIEFTVQDTGIGIAEGDYEKLFKPFSQLQHPRGGTQDGAGLGLYLSLAMARQLGGEIRFTSRPGAGSSFTLTLRQESRTRPAP